MKILVRSPNWIGDQVMAYPFFFHLRKKYPDAHITAVCVPWVKYIQYFKQIDEVVVEDREMLKSNSLFDYFQNYRQFFSEVKSRGPFDLAYVLPNSFSSAMLSYFSGAKQRIGYTGDFRSSMLTDKLNWETLGDSLHRAEAYLRVLGENYLSDGSVFDFFDSIPLNQTEVSEPGVCEKFDFEKEWPASQSAKVNEFIQSFENSHFWVLAPGSTASSRQWSEEKFLEFSLKMKEAKPHWKGVVVGSSKDTAIAYRLQQRAGLIDWTARGSVSALAPLFAKAQFTLCNESGLAHVASLCGSKVQIICGAADPKRTKPIGPGLVQVAVNPISCWPCEKNICQWVEPRKNSCLKGITSQDVMKELEFLL